jgi:hypothetical protein
VAQYKKIKSLKLIKIIIIIIIFLKKKGRRGVKKWISLPPTYKECRSLIVYLIFGQYGQYIY